ncbi:unnamed protein product [Lactuca virosa]|uniref:Uncharacterized protein n=1 Tax=Lactuca virosa TaxID=75947 RepID=A0AAU9P1J0_9ASTR|nr:unnamed protein product [Lactuca virosa]
MVATGDDISTIVFKVDNHMLDRYTYEYHLSPILGFQLPPPSSSVLDDPFDGSKYPFQLTSYLAGEFHPKAIMLDDVIPDPDVDPMIVIPDSSIRLLGFGPADFSVDQLFEPCCPLIAPSHVGSSRSVDGVFTDIPCTSRKRKRLLTPLQFEQFLCEVSHGPRYVSSLPSEYDAPKSADM